MDTSRDLNSTGHKWCWGSIAPSRGPGWNPLVAEMLAAASTLLELWQHALTPAQGTEITKSLAAQDEHCARRAAAFLVGVSRLGHASPAHMVSFGAGLPRSQALDHTRTAWRQGALRAGLPLPQAGSRVRYTQPHYVTAAVLPRLTGCDCAGYVDGERCRNPDHRCLYTVAYALNTHGADILHADMVAKAYGATGGPAWDAVRAALVRTVAHHVGIDARWLPLLIRPTHPSQLTLLNRLVAQCGRLAEGSTFDVFPSPHSTDETLSDLARRHAKEAVSRLTHHHPRAASPHGGASSS
ncbi:HD domain-containing protein [Streptomyces acidiscabies]|uniref:HD domain-containing protein n=1 Tax=Streptomyces acidiscabies TaxID=42234 RepID=UPI000A487282|nr:HD domain-containing protein [Streptomyces acidiscabies]